MVRVTERQVWSDACKRGRSKLDDYEAKALARNWHYCYVARVRAWSRRETGKSMAQIRLHD